MRVDCWPANTGQIQHPSAPGGVTWRRRKAATARPTFLQKAVPSSRREEGKGQLEWKEGKAEVNPGEAHGLGS